MNEELNGWINGWVSEQVDDWSKKWMIDEISEWGIGRGIVWRIATAKE
jgi:hypothetical protein